jgi:endonuclease/exonuclease/phosphatase family metal-dependent hydrolase
MILLDSFRRTLVLRLTLSFACSFAILCNSANADPFQILAWNVESNRPDEPPVSDATKIASELVELMKDPQTKASVVALSEVDPKSIAVYQQAVSNGLSSTVDYVSSASGGFADSDSLLLVVDRSRFEIVDTTEIHRYAGIIANFNITEPDSPEYGALRARSPLAVRLKDLTSQKEFWVIVNHLARGEVKLRTEQAKMLRQWALDRKEPVIAVGDFNFDFDFKTQKGNFGFNAMMEGEVWTWLKPDPLVDSNWSDDRRVTDRRVDRYPDSILDFVFVANEAKQWNGKSNVVVREGDFPDSDETSDHRPIISSFAP